MPDLKGRLVVTSAACAALVGLSVLTATAASADVNQCPNGDVCLWKDADYRPKADAYSGRNVYEDAHPGMLDEASSWANKTGFTYCLFDWRGGTRYILDRLPANTARSYVGGDANDKADAIGRCG